MIRALGEHDLDAYVALRRRSLIEAAYAFSATPGRDLGSNIEHLRAQLPKAPDWMLLGAFLGDELAGAAGMIRNDDKVSLWGMYVVPEHRRGGHGQELLDACIAHARTIPGVTRVELAVKDEAEAARRLYGRAGFVPAGDRMVLGIF
jgi:RimJ/RimL family protein N-acetyltransferase